MALVNGFQPAAWGIDGARHNAELMRFALYASTGGAEGIVEATDLKVHQLTTPGTQVVIDAGGVLVKNRSASQRNQSYGLNGRLESRLDVAATGGSSRSDLVCLRPKDPQYAPWTTVVGGGDPLTFQYAEPFIVQNVPSNTTSFASLNLGYSGYALARLDLPAGTTNVTNAMIVDLRKLAQPRRDPFLERYDHATGVVRDYTGNLNTYVRMPSDVPFASLVVPTWATRATVRVDVGGLQFVTGNLAGGLRYKMTGGSPSTSVYTKETYVNEQQWDSGSRKFFEISSEVAIPASMRGFTLQGNPEWKRTGGSGTLRTGQDTQVVVDITWLEVAD
jgi:hypothetical protein